MYGHARPAVNLPQLVNSGLHWSCSAQSEVAFFPDDTAAESHSNCTNGARDPRSDVRWADSVRHRCAFCSPPQCVRHGPGEHHAHSPRGVAGGVRRFNLSFEARASADKWGVSGFLLEENWSARINCVGISRGGRPARHRPLLSDGFTRSNLRCCRRRFCFCFAEPRLLRTALVRSGGAGNDRPVRIVSPGLKCRPGVEPGGGSGAR